MIGKLSQDEKANWPKHLPELIQAYNGTRSTITGYSPHYLLFGYSPWFPIDLHFPTVQKRHVVCIDDFVASSNNVSLKHSMRHTDKMYLKLINKNDIMTGTLVLWC